MERRTLGLPRSEPTRRGLALTAPRLLVLSFTLLIALGTLGFRLAPGLAAGPALGWVDALFMATSAVCVTGLSVLDVSRELTVAGQIWLLLLIQAGALGILTFAGALVGMVGGRASLAVEEAVQGPAVLVPSPDPYRLVRMTVTGTLAAEAVGAVLLWVAWRSDFGALGAIWPATFHAVSAFCNAGFSLFSDSLMGFREQEFLLLAVAGLILAGGIGFPVLEDLRLRLLGRRTRTTLHTRLTLAATATLLVGSTLLYRLLEADHSLAALPPHDRTVNALFMAVTARTAGFHTVDYDAVANASVLLTLALMWIGGGPASVAGGVKVTTVALLGLLLASRLRGDRAVSAFGRSVPPETVQRATGLAVGAFLILALAVFLILALEGLVDAAPDDRVRLTHLVFEVQSALGTVGLSMGETARLTPVGRLLIVAVMLLGRIGPLVALAAMVLRRRRRAGFRYAHEEVLVG